MVILLLSSVLSSGVFAGSMGADGFSDPCWGPEGSCTINPQPDLESPWRRVATFSIGPAWSNNGETQTFYLQPDIQKTYTATYNSNILPYGELFLGMQKQLNRMFFSQLGIAIAGGSEAKLRGDIWEDADPNFNNYTYTYGVSEARVMVKGKLLVDIGYYGTRPYISGALGVGFNNSHAFTITPNIYEEVAAPIFESNVNTVFTYALGIGLQEVLNEHWQVGIGYDFSDWGKSQLAAANGQTVNQGLLINNLYINSVLLNVSYLWG